MSIARFAIGESAIAQGEAASVKSKTPPKRTSVALADARSTPEPR